MIPGEALSDYSGSDDFLVPDDLFTTCEPSEDWESGGVALNDASLGLFVKTWRAYASGGKVIVTDETTETELFEVAGIVREVSLAFDQLMSPQVAFVEDGAAKFWYYDTVLQAYTILALTDAVTPRCFLDDKRGTQTSSSDVILVYLRGGGLYYRQQRDRFQTEYLLMETAAPGIGRCGMTVGNRVRIDLLQA